MERSAGKTDESRNEASEEQAEVDAERSAGRNDDHERNDDHDSEPAGEGGDPAGPDQGSEPRFPWEEPEEDDEPGVVARNLEELREEAAEDARNLHEGRAVGVFGTPLPLRMIGAISVFVGAFVVVYLLTWAALGDIGLAVGVFIAAIVGVIAVKLFASLGSGGASSAG